MSIQPDLDEGRGLITEEITIRSVADADALMATIRTAAARMHDWVARQVGDPLAMLKRMKFEAVGFHPVEGHPLNLVEQINQT